MENCTIQALAQFLNKGCHVGMQALVLYQAAAELGDPAGLMALGYMHMHGFGTPRNTSAAIDLYEGAALMGYPDACYNLGSLYGGEISGLPCPADRCARHGTQSP